MFLLDNCTLLFIHARFRENQTEIVCVVSHPHSSPIEVALYELTSPVKELLDGGLLQNGGLFSTNRGLFS